VSNFPEGAGFFETIKTVNGVPKFLDLHLVRAEATGKRLGMRIPKQEIITKEILDFIANNPLETSTGRLRIEFLDSKKRHISHAPYDPWKEPARLTLTTSRVVEKAHDAGIKTLPYSLNLQLLERARSAGFDEVIRLNSRDYICEGATSNLLLKIEGEWVTPDLESGCLPGITRALCLGWFPITERPVHREELADVESAFILSSLREVQPASCIGPHELLIDRAMEIEARARMQAHSLE
jgi:branched-chain amino acid aminotransferase